MTSQITHVIKALENCSISNDAKPGYDVMAGGLYWDDEIPDRESSNYLKVVYYLRTIFAYRASLTLGEERTEFRGDWQELKKAVPQWPGFQDERINGELARRLLRVNNYKLNKNLDEMLDIF